MKCINKYPKSLYIPKYPENTERVNAAELMGAALETDFGSSLRGTRPSPTHEYCPHPNWLLSICHRVPEGPLLRGLQSSYGDCHLSQAGTGIRPRGGPAAGGRTLFTTCEPHPLLSTPRPAGKQTPKHPFFLFFLLTVKTPSLHLGGITTILWPLGGRQLGMCKSYRRTILETSRASTVMTHSPPLY